MLTGHLVFLFAKSGNYEREKGRCEHPEVGRAWRGPSTAWRLPAEYAVGGGAGDGGRARSLRATGATVSISVFILSRMEDVGGF